MKGRRRGRERDKMNEQERKHDREGNIYTKVNRIKKKIYKNSMDI